MDGYTKKTGKVGELLILLFLGVLIHSLRVMSIGWGHTILDQYGFRQTQTAISTYYLLKGGPWFAYWTPVLGPPWSIPFEFPLFQWITAGLVAVSHLPLDQAGRLISALFFYLSLIPIYFELQLQDVNRSSRLVIPILLLASPLYLFWSRTFMIESCALFFALTYLWVACLYLKHRTTVFLALTGVFGTIAALVKITTFAGAACGLALIVLFLIREPPPQRVLFRYSAIRPYVAVLILAFPIPLLVTYAWVIFGDAQKHLNPLAEFILSSSLNRFNFGTLDLRLSAEFWRVMWTRAIRDITGFSLSVLVCAALVPVIKGKRRAVLWCTAIFLLAPLIFANLHFVHSYYQYENGVFLLAGLGFVVVDLLERGRRDQILGLALLLILVACGIRGYYSLYYKSQRGNSLSLFRTAKAIQTNTQENDVLLIFGSEWSSEIPYYSQRRAIIVRENWPPEDSRLRKSIAGLGPLKIGGMAVCAYARAELPLIERRIQTYDLQEKPSYSDENCSLYLPTNRPPSQSANPR